VAGVGGGEHGGHGLTLTTSTVAAGDRFGASGAPRLRLSGCAPALAGRRRPTFHHIPRRSPVAANCDVCGKGPGFGHSISHSHRRTKRRWNPNIQRVKALVGDAGVTPKRLNVCTSCLKAGKVKR